MILSSLKHRYLLAYRLVLTGTVLCFVLSLLTIPGQAFADTELSMPLPGSRVQSSHHYIPPVIKGVTVHPDKPFHFDFLIDNGNAHITGKDFENESLRLIKYFLASLAVPDEDLWVNLSPFEENRVIPDTFGQTEMGRDLLAQDYLLKQFTASLMYPEDQLGAEFWRRVHQKAQARFGTTEIPVATFNKVWIVPDTAVIHEHGTSAFVAESRLKVMLEEDYLALSNNTLQEQAFEQLGQGDEYRGHRREITQEIIRDILIPEIEREVNEGEHFARLRQIYHSLLLATWYKENMRQSVINQIYSNQNKVEGVGIPDDQTKEDIYEQYVQAFRTGVYNYVKEEYDSTLDTVIPRKYFSGGMNIRPRITTIRNPRAVRQTGDMALLSIQFDATGGGGITSRVDRAQLSEDQQRRADRGERLRAMEYVLIHQLNSLTGSLRSLLDMYSKSPGFGEGEAREAYADLYSQVQLDNLKSLFVTAPADDDDAGNIRVADAFEGFRARLLEDLDILQNAVRERNQAQYAGLLTRVIDDTRQYLRRVFDQQLQIKATNIAAKMRDYVHQFENTRGISINLRMPEENIGGFQIDQLRMAEVFYILFNNAREAGGDISVSVDLSADNSEVVVAVSDTGAGITPENLARIFDLNFTTKGEAGTKERGIGLNYAKNIVEMHGGTISVASEVGAGTTFTLTIPRGMVDHAVLAEDDAQRVDRGDRLKAMEHVFVNQLNLLTVPLHNLLATYAKIPGFRSDAFAEAVSALEKSFRPENLEQIFAPDHAGDVPAARIEISDRFEQFRQSVTINLGILQGEVMGHRELRMAQMLLKMIEDTSQFIERVLDQKLQLRAVNIAEKLREYVSQFQSTRKIPVRVVLPRENIGGFRIDALRMAEVFYVLLNNAREAGGVITVSAELSGDKTEVIFRVTDTGAGIPAENLAKIFEQGFTTKEAAPTGNRGIGLSYAKDIVEMHGGHIDVESALGKGTTFTVTIPRGVDGPMLTGVVADVLRDIKVQAKKYQGGRADLRDRVAKARAELLETEKDRFLTVGIVPDGTEARRATFDVRLRQPHMNLFSQFDEGPMRVSINNRIVRSILFYDAAGELMRVSIDPPNHIISHNTGLPVADERQVGVDLMIESARFLTDYDVATERFGPDQSVKPDTLILFRGPPIPGVQTVGDLAQQVTRHISDKAILVNPHMVETWDYLYAKRTKDLNQNQLANEVGRTRGHINKIVKGRDLPGDELFEAILAALQLDDEHRVIARKKLQVARDNRSPVPQSFIDLGKKLRDLRLSVNAVQYVRQHGRVNFKTEAETAAAAGASPAVIQAALNGDVVPEDALFERIMKAYKLEGKYQDSARQRLTRQREQGLMTWKELTEKLKITEAYLSQLETGKMISARPLLRQMLTLYHPDQELLDRILILHKIAHMDVSIRNTGKTAINFRDFKSPDRVELVRKVLDYYWQYDKTRKTPDQVTEQEIEWARYFRLSEWVYDQVHEFLQPLETNLDFNFSQLFLSELIWNAIDSVHSKFSGAYGLGRLTVQVERKGETIVVHLIDNGTGVNEEWIGEFGTREFSAAETGKEKAVLRYLGGSGIGLRQVYHDANERGIEVKAANLPTGEGAVFSVLIPEKLFMANGNGDAAVLGQTEGAENDGASGVRTDQAVLSRERILTFLRGVPGLRFGFNQSLSEQARLFNNQLLRSKETQAVVFGVLPQPGNLAASEFDVLALTGQAGHGELFKKDIRLTNNIVRGTFFKVSSEGIPQIVFKSPNSLSFDDEHADVRRNLMILSARYLTGYDEASGEFVPERAVIQENHQLLAQAPDGSFEFRGPIRDFAQRDLLGVTPPEGTTEARDSAILSKDVGGIDLTAERINLQIRRDEAGVPMPLDAQQLQNIHINGLIPVIINIQPVTNLPLLIGAADGPDDEPVGAAPRRGFSDSGDTRQNEALPPTVALRMSLLR